MKICLAQIKPLKGDIEQNIANHIKFIDRAADLGASAIFFPELSLTGYEPALAKDLATTKDDTRFAIFQRFSDAKSMTIAVGIPLLANDGIQIGMIIFQPNQEVKTYSKQLLHHDEEPCFVRGKKQVIITINDLQIAPTICYESLQPEHAQKANDLGANLYVASVAKSTKGIEKAYRHYPQIAAQYAMPVLMANSVGHCDNFIAAGRSGVWSKNGTLLGQLDDRMEGLLLFETAVEKASAHLF